MSNVIGWGAVVLLSLINILLFVIGHRRHQRFLEKYKSLTGHDFQIEDHYD